MFTQSALDLKTAGIAKRDERGRTVWLHSLRHTFGTLLSRRGVAPRTAQAAMRHSRIDLTMGVFTDPRLLGVTGALDVLPSLPLDDSLEHESEQATGTAPRQHVPTTGNSCISGANDDNTAAPGASTCSVVSVGVDDDRTSQSAGDQMEQRGLEPLTLALQRRCSPN